MKFEMLIRDIFKLSNGQTVLSGLIAVPQHLFSACECTLVLGGTVRQDIHIDGKMHLKKTDPANLQRALSTRDHAALSLEEALSGEWRRVCKQE